MFSYLGLWIRIVAFVIDYMLIAGCLNLMIVRSSAYRMIPNAQEIEETCGNDRTGWLFKG